MMVDATSLLAYVAMFGLYTAPMLPTQVPPALVQQSHMRDTTGHLLLVLVLLVREVCAHPMTMQS